MKGKVRSSYLLAVAEEEIWRVWGTTRLISCRGGKYFLLFFASHFMPPVVKWEYFFYNFLHLISCQMSRGDIFYSPFASHFMPPVVKRGIFFTIFLHPISALHDSCQEGNICFFFASNIIPVFEWEYFLLLFCILKDKYFAPVKRSLTSF